MTAGRVTPGADTRVLALLDRVARRAIDAAAPVRFAVAGSDADRIAAYRLRFSVAIDRRLARPEDLPGGVERDAHDDGAIHVVGWADGEAVATARIVLPEAGRLLPTEEEYGVQISPAGEVVDVGRFAIDRRFTGPGHATFAGLMGTVWLSAREHGYSRMCGGHTPGMVELFRRMGFRVFTVGPPRTVWGEQRHAVQVDVVGSSGRLIGRWLARGAT